MLAIFEEIGRPVKVSVELNQPPRPVPARILELLTNLYSAPFAPKNDRPGASMERKMKRLPGRPSGQVANVTLILS